MKNKVRLHYFLIGILVALFVSICACFAIISSGYVDTKRLIIYTGSAEKAYDGVTLTSTDYGIKNGTLKDGHSLIVETYGRQTEIGASFNTFHYTIVDKEGNSVTDEYRVIEAPGLLIVHEEGWIDWEKFDIEKYKNIIDKFGNIDFGSSGLDLEDMDLEELLKNIDWENLTEEEKEMIKQAIAAKILASMAGGTDTDGDGIPDSMDDDANGNGIPDDQEGAGDGTGEGAGLGGAGEQRFDNNLQSEGNGFGENPDQEVLQFRSENSGEYYLRYESFGDYNGSGFDFAQEYTDSVVSPMYYAGTALKNSNMQMERVFIENLDGSGAYYLPYYAITGITDETGDVRFSRSSDEYLAKLAGYDYLSDNTSYTLPDEFKSVESKYRDYVNENYLTIDSNLKRDLRNMTNFSSSGKALVRQIKEYVQSAASYNLDFEKFPDGEDMILYFLREGKEGICQHFAAAATMIFRAYGIPARYTCGYKVNAIAGDWTVVTAKYAHAWVEIYVNGFGWVQIEVTGGAFDEVRKNEISISTPSLTKIYDANQFDYSEVVKWELTSGRLKDGHSIVPVIKDVVDMPIYAGTYENFGYVYKIIDKNGVDVADEYEIKNVSYGTLTIDKRPITVYANGYTENPEEIWLKTEYAGKSQSFADIYKIGDDSKDESMVYGDVIEVLTSTSKTEIGIYDNEQTYKITNSRGDDVTEQYEIIAKAGRFEITKIKLYVVTDSYEHQYDGEYALCEKFTTRRWDSQGNVYGSIISEHTTSVDKDSIINNIKEIGQTSENVFDLIISDDNGDDVTDKYYEITYEYGSLSVIKRQIEIYTGYGEMEYDYEETLLSNEEPDEVINAKDSGVETLLDGHELRVLDLYETGEIGKHQNTTTYYVFDTVTQTDVTEEYYDITYGKYGEFFIYIPLIVQTGTIVEVYDAENNKGLSTEEFTEHTGNALLEGHQITVDEPHIIYEPTMKPVKNDTTFKVVDGSGNNVTEMYYKLTYHETKGTIHLMVDPVYIYVSANDMVKEYDGNPLKYTYDLPGYTLMEGQELAAADHRVVITANSRTSAGSSSSVVVKVYNGSGKDVTDNFYLIKVSGKITITKKALNVSVEDITVTYDGKVHTATMENVKVSGLVGGHTVSGKIMGEKKDVGQVEISLTDVKVYDGSGKDVTKNYSLNIDDTGILTIEHPTIS